MNKISHFVYYVSLSCFLIALLLLNLMYTIFLVILHLLLCYSWMITLLYSRTFSLLLISLLFVIFILAVDLLLKFLVVLF